MLRQNTELSDLILLAIKQQREPYLVASVVWAEIFLACVSLKIKGLVNPNSNIFYIEKFQHFQENNLRNL